MAHLDQLHPRIQAVEPETGLLTRPFFRWLTQLYEKLGGPSDFIQDLEIGELYEPGITDSQLIVVKKQLNDLQNELDVSPIWETKYTEIKKQLEDLQNELDMSPIWTTNNFFTTKVFSTGTAFTTYDNCIVVATSNITVTLNPNPKDQEKAIIKRNTTAGEVTISSSPINIDGASTYVLLMNYEAAHCVYSATDNEWFIV